MYPQDELRGAYKVELRGVYKDARFAGNKVELSPRHKVNWSEGSLSKFNRSDEPALLTMLK
jgi:hypothetical protein